MAGLRSFLLLAFALLLVSTFTSANPVSTERTVGGRNADGVITKQPKSNDERGKQFTASVNYEGKTPCFGKQKCGGNFSCHC